MFLLRKWYLDCVTADGQALIAYRAQVQWGALKLGYASMLRRTRGGDGDSTETTLRPGDEPVEEPDMVRWACPRLAVEGRWRRACSRVERRLIDGPEGILTWRCVMPRAECEVTVGELGPVRGLGYAESLEMTVAPWGLPIQELRWGRWLSESSSLVWIRWTGPRPLTLVLEDGREIAGEVGDDAVALRDGRTLALERARTIREGELGATVLAGIPKLRDVVPPAILRTSEQKWLSRGRLGAAIGWAIHERVAFGRG